MRRLIWCWGCLLSASAVVSSLTACSDNNTTVMPGKIDPETFATMTSRNVVTLISDSGITRYKIEAPLWLVFDEAREPRWTFPEGLDLERFNNLFQTEATVRCDSATYFKDKQLWRLDGYVDIANMAGERFLTPQLFWDQKKQIVYSDSFIHIERADRVIEGYGFESNDRMTRYNVRNVQAILPVDQMRGGSQEPSDSSSVDNSAPTDSLSGGTAPADSLGSRRKVRSSTVNRPPVNPFIKRSDDDALQLTPAR